MIIRTGAAAKPSAAAMVWNISLIILMDIPISANHCEVLMQSQIRYKREELDSYTIKWSVSW